MYKVLFVAPEVVPFAKTGGLADVAGTLPLALHRLGCDIRIVMPFYRMVENVATECSLVARGIPIPVGSTTYTADVWETRLRHAVPVYLIKCDEFFDRSNLYGTAQGDYRDNAQRFIFFSRGTLETCITLDYTPDIVHCHDWQTGLVPVYLKTSYRHHPCLAHAGSVFTIHNIAYQGVFNADAFALTRLPAPVFGMEGLEYWGKMSILKGALMFADVINTVSKKYSQEIQTPEFGYGMEGILARRSADLYGILNGVDYDEWNPATDPYIAAPYTSADLSGKLLCKQDVLKDYNLPARLKSKPLLGVISRLADQKGFDLLAAIIDKLMARDLGFVLLGTGDQKYHDLFTAIARTYPRKSGIKITYDNTVAHKIEAGCDIFLMPSRYEPCGLNQIYSLKYGTVPVVRATGGLDDTIIDYDERTGQGNGFKFSAYDADDFFQAIERALSLYAKKPQWTRLVKHCMTYDFSWEQSARRYLELYGKAVAKVTSEE